MYGGEVQEIEVPIFLKSDSQFPFPKGSKAKGFFNEQLVLEGGNSRRADSIFYSFFSNFVVQKKNIPLILPDSFLTNARLMGRGSVISLTFFKKIRSIWSRSPPLLFKKIRSRCACLGFFLSLPHFVFGKTLVEKK